MIIEGEHLNRPSTMKKILISKELKKVAGTIFFLIDSALY